MKRITDILFCILLLVIFFILIILIAFLVKISSRGPVLYWSKRVGRYNKIFYMPKFRSMMADTPEVASDLLNEPGKYITRIGNFLRKSSLDEIPQLYSILIGQMSFVGPRPALHNQNNLIRNRRIKGISNIRPGLTGWAQVNGRDEISDIEKVKYDLEYLENYSLMLDLKILWKTFFHIFKKKNISH